MKTDRILFLGNSITLHPPRGDVGWDGNWGMAASALEHDYVHVLLRRFAAAGGGRQPDVVVENIADFERQYDSLDVHAAYGNQIAFRPDIVIVAIGENVPALTSEQAGAAFATALARLLAALKQNGAPAIFVRSCFWPDAVKDDIMRQVCQEAGGAFIDISALSADEANYARAERAFAHACVAAHPGDTGMRAIADAIWNVLTAAASTSGSNDASTVAPA